MLNKRSSIFSALKKVPAFIYLFLKYFKMCKSVGWQTWQAALTRDLMCWTLLHVDTETDAAAGSGKEQMVL